MSLREMSTADAPVEPEKKSRKLLVVAVLALALAAGAWWFMIRPAGADEGSKAGEVLQLESIQVNLEGGHYLKIGVALQAVEGAEHVEGSKALDATIELFSGRSMAELADPKRREQLRSALVEELGDRYHGEVMEVYFTDFVTQ